MPLIIPFQPPTKKRRADADLANDIDGLLFDCFSAVNLSIITHSVQVNKYIQSHGPNLRHERSLVLSSVNVISSKLLNMVKLVFALQGAQCNTDTKHLYLFLDTNYVQYWLIKFSNLLLTFLDSSILVNMWNCFYCSSDSCSAFWGKIYRGFYLYLSDCQYFDTVGWVAGSASGL